MKALGHRRKLMAAVREPPEGQSASQIKHGPASPFAMDFVPTIHTADLVLGEKLGSGSFGAVYLGAHLAWSTCSCSSCSKNRRSIYCPGILHGTTEVAVKQLKEVDSQASLLAEARLMGYSLGTYLSLCAC